MLAEPIFIAARFDGYLVMHCPTGGTWREIAKTESYEDAHIEFSETCLDKPNGATVVLVWDKRCPYVAFLEAGDYRAISVMRLK